MELLDLVAKRRKEKKFECSLLAPIPIAIFGFYDLQEFLFGLWKETWNRTCYAFA